MAFAIINRKLLLCMCVFIIMIIMLGCFILWTYVSFYILKWLKSNIDSKLYFNSYKTSCIKTLEKYGDLPIKRMYLVRTNVNSFLTFLLDLVTWKSYSAQLRRYREIVNDDTFFPSHTYMMVEVELENKMRKILLIEKTNGIEITTNFRRCETQEMLKINISKNKITTINALLGKTKERMGHEQFFNWNFYKNNCHQFMDELLKSMRKTNPRYRTFFSHPHFFEIIKIPDSVMYMMNSAINIMSFIESVYMDIKF